MTRKQKDALNRFAADVRASLVKYDNVSLSALNYGLRVDVEALGTLRRMLPDATTDGCVGPLGYIHFKRAAPSVELPGGEK